MYRIKGKLGLPIPPVDDVDSLIVDPEPQLLIALNYEKRTKARTERIKDIEKTLLTENIIPRYI